MTEAPRKLADTMARAVQAAANRLLAMDGDTAAKLAAFRGRTVAFHLEGPDIWLYMTPEAGGLRVESEGEAETTLRGTPGALFASALSDPEQLAAGRIHIEGDAHLGQAFERLARRLKPDWEEPLARAFGDVVGPRIARALRGGFRWGRDSGVSVAEQISEYLREESGQLVSRAEMDDFLAEVDNLRDAVERLQARIEHLRRDTDA